MRQRQPALPRLWLVSDARNDAGLERALASLPRGSGFIYRHYHLTAPERRRRFDALRRLARKRRHMVALAADARTARRWGADAAYGAPPRMARTAGFPFLATAHSLREIRMARNADAILLSPVFATRSHPGTGVLGPIRFRVLAAHSPLPVIALGGMTRHTAKRLKGYAWAAIDGLSAPDS